MIKHILTPTSRKPSLYLEKERLHTPETDRKLSLQRKVSNVYKIMFRSELHKSKLIKLEKEILRGETFEKQEKFISGTIRNRSNSECKNQNKNRKLSDKGISIVRLPLLPFGSHLTYNNEESFVEDHIINLEEINQKTIKFQSIKLKSPENKRETKKNLLNLKNLKLSQYSGLDVYNMESGELFCTRNTSVVDAYENGIQLRKPKIIQTFRNIDLTTKSIEKKKINTN